MQRIISVLVVLATPLLLAAGDDEMRGDVLGRGRQDGGV